MYPRKSTPDVWHGPSASHARRGPGTVATRMSPAGELAIELGSLGGRNSPTFGARSVAASTCTRSPLVAVQTIASHFVASWNASSTRARSLMRTEWARTRRSCAEECHPHLAAPRNVDALHGVHQAAHEEQAAAVFAVDVLRRSRIDELRFDVEAFSFVADLEDEARFVHLGAHVHVFRGVVSIAAENRVGDGFGERDGNVERDLAASKPHGLALSANELDDGFD